MKLVSIVLILLAIAIVGFGLSAATGAPQEAVVVALGLFLLVLARIAQAEDNFNKLQKPLNSILAEIQEKTTSTSTKEEDHKGKKGNLFFKD